MDIFPLGTDVVVAIPFQDLAGNAVTPTALAYVVRDADGDLVVTSTPIANLSGTSTTITMPANTFELTGGYSIELTISVDANTYVQEVDFGITAQTQRLEFLKNSFQTRAGALFIAKDIPNLSTFMTAVTSDQELALIEAYRRITRLNFWINWPELLDLQDRIVPYWQVELTPRMWPMMTPSFYAVYPADFRDALNRAQVTEANAVLTLDPNADFRRGGVFSEKIGESSIMFKSGVKPLDGPLSRDAMAYLTGYLNNRVTLTRS